MNVFLSLFLVLLCAVTLSAAPAADLVIVNANVWTVDPSLARAEAIAILGDRIVAVGTRAEVLVWKGPKTKVMDAGGKLLLPGFNDSHVHFVSGGSQLEQVDLKNTESPEAFGRMISERAKATPEGEWILGGNWDDQGWNPAKLPVKEMIDAFTEKHPVFLNRYDGHMALANSQALRLAGITRETPDPPGGTIVRDEAGEPTGVLKDAAMSPVYRIIPPMSREQRLRVVKRALEHAASLGVTSVQDMSPEYQDISAYAELAESGELTTRIYAAPLETDWKDQARLGIRRAFGSSYLRLGAVKGFVDGSLGSSTAYFFEPFTDDPANHGLLSDEMQPPEAMYERMKDADGAGLQLCIHAIGDQGISIVLDFFSRIEQGNGKRDRRFRIEHSQHLAAKDFSRFANLNVIASMQPYHAIDDGRWAEKRIGHDRSSRTYSFRTFIDHGVKLAFGTDWNVAPLNPMLSIDAAVNRVTLDGKHPDGWFPEQKITVKETVEAYTMGSAYAEFQELEKGSVTIGKLADLVLLSDNIFEIDPSKIKDTFVLMTIVGGKVVYSREK